MGVHISQLAHEPRHRFLRGSGTGRAQNNFGRYNVWRGSLRLEDTSYIGLIGGSANYGKHLKGSGLQIDGNISESAKKNMGKPSHKSKVALDSSRAFK